MWSRGEYSDVIQILLLLGVFGCLVLPGLGFLSEFQKMWSKCWYVVLSGSYFWGLSRRTMFLNGFGAGNVDKTADIEESTCSKTKK